MEFLSRSETAKALGLTSVKSVLDLEQAGFLTGMYPDPDPVYPWPEVENLLVAGLRISPLRAAGRIANALWPDGEQRYADI